MKKYSLRDFLGGWFIGNFKPTLLDTKKFEVCVKHYKKGQRDDIHFHKKAIEFTIVISGKFKINREVYKKDDIIIMHPLDISRFSCIEKGSIVAIKTPSIKNDKYIIHN